MTVLIELGQLGIVEAGILMRVLDDQFQMRDHWHQHPPRLMSSEDLAHAEDERLVIGMIRERIAVECSRCRHCGEFHVHPPDDLCPEGQREWAAASELERVLLGAIECEGRGHVSPAGGGRGEHP